MLFILIRFYFSKIQSQFIYQLHVVHVHRGVQPVKKRKNYSAGDRQSFPPKQQTILPRDHTQLHPYTGHAITHTYIHTRTLPHPKNFPPAKGRRCRPPTTRPSGQRTDRRRDKTPPSELHGAEQKQTGQTRDTTQNLQSGGGHQGATSQSGAEFNQGDTTGQDTEWSEAKLDRAAPPRGKDDATLARGHTCTTHSSSSSRHEGRHEGGHERRHMRCDTNHWLTHPCAVAAGETHTLTHFHTAAAVAATATGQRSSVRPSTC